MKRDPSQAARGALDLIEEATHLLRDAPPAVLAWYYIGALPCVLGWLVFWADMSHNTFARQHLAQESLLLAALFMWMKVCQAVFLHRVRALAAGQAASSLTLAQTRRLFVHQAALQPTGLFLLPLALLLVFPLGWAYAFYQNLTALEVGQSEALWVLCKRAWRQTAIWPRQNHALLALMAGFGLYVFLNQTTVAVMLPGLAKMLLGVETAFSRSPMSVLNTTFFAVILGMTYLCVDPILKVVYALRCFYGESRTTGEDLVAQLRPFAASEPAATEGAALAPLSRI